MAYVYEGNIVFRRPEGYSEDRSPDWSSIAALGKTAIVTPRVTNDSVQILLKRLLREQGDREAGVRAEVEQGETLGDKSTRVTVIAHTLSAPEAGAGMTPSFEGVRVAVDIVNAVIRGTAELSGAWDVRDSREPDESGTRPPEKAGALDIFTGMHLGAPGGVGIEGLIVLDPEWLRES